MSGSKNGFRFKQNGLDGRGSCQSLETSNFGMLSVFFSRFFLGFFRDPKQKTKQNSRLLVPIAHRSHFHSSIPSSFSVVVAVVTDVDFCLCCCLFFIFLLSLPLHFCHEDKASHFFFKSHFLKLAAPSSFSSFFLLILFLSSCSSPPLVPSSLFSSHFFSSFHLLIFVRYLFVARKRCLH